MFIHKIVWDGIEVKLDPAEPGKLSQILTGQGFFFYYYNFLKKYNFTEIPK